MEGAVFQGFLLGAVEVGEFRKVVEDGEEEAAGAAGGVADGLAGLRGHDIDNGGDEGAGREVLTCAAFDVGGVLFEETLVGVALEIGVEGGPGFLVDEIGDEAAELGRVLDLVLRLAEDDAQHARALTQFFKGVAVMDFKLVAIKGDELVPAETLGDGG